MEALGGFVRGFPRDPLLSRLSDAHARRTRRHDASVRSEGYCEAVAGAGDEGGRAGMGVARHASSGALCSTG